MTTLLMTYRMHTQNQKTHHHRKRIEEDVMKTYTVLVALMTLAAASTARSNEPGYFSSTASYSHTNIAKAERGYMACLATANDGVVESALAHVAMMKLAMPDGDYRTLESRVAEVARTAASPETRYKAFLTEMVLKDAKIFEGVATSGYESADGLFGALASRLGEYYAAR